MTMKFTGWDVRSIHCLKDRGFQLLCTMGKFFRLLHKTQFIINVSHITHTPPWLRLVRR